MSLNEEVELLRNIPLFAKLEGSKLRVHLPAHSFVTVSGALA